ncbi:MAG: segregation and condensation protein A [Gammaproteobacteria bacterium]|nr:segregation and condensation protein A [Gammaproteobacteria bacterium]MBU1415927.1 segregation and condensation protein A [Gammaproteobacteria bacterium]
MGFEELSKEQRILRLLRKTLGNIVKDTAPRPGVPNPLGDDTVVQIKELFALISERERELADEAGFDAKERPYFSDEPPATRTVDFHKPPKKPN